jgi:hypothetical protein
MKKFRLLLLDANVVIVLCKLGLWGFVLGGTKGTRLESYDLWNPYDLSRVPFLPLHTND